MIKYKILFKRKICRRVLAGLLAVTLLTTAGGSCGCFMNAFALDEGSVKTAAAAGVAGASETADIYDITADGSAESDQLSAFGAVSAESSTVSALAAEASDNTEALAASGTSNSTADAESTAAASTATKSTAAALDDSDTSAEAGEAGDVAETGDAAETGEDAETAETGDAAETAESLETAENEESGLGAAETPDSDLSADAESQEAAGSIEDIEIEEDITGLVSLKWTVFEGANLYKVSVTLPKKTGVSWKGSDPECSFSGLSRSTAYSFSIKAYSDSKAKNLIAQGSADITTKKVVFDESSYRTIKSKKVKASKLNVNLRTMIGESDSGYAVAQGGCTDGKYAYYMMASSYTQKGRVLKVRISDNKVIKKGPVINTHHGNGMTYDSKRKLLVAVGYGSWRHQLSFIDPKTLKLVKQENVTYPYKKMEAVQNSYNKNGIAAIAYVKKYDVYVARTRGDKVSGGVNDLMVFNADNLKLIGYIRTKITSKYPETYQSMDADDKYVYLLLSAGSGQPYNIILALDWNSENLLPVVNGEKNFITDMWHCNNDDSGEPDAVVRIKTSHEVEGLFHITDSKTGKQHFYVSEYCSSIKYKTVTRKNKKGKKYKARVSYFGRDDYVYDLGVI